MSSILGIANVSFYVRDFLGNCGDIGISPLCTVRTVGISDRTPVLT